MQRKWRLIVMGCIIALGVTGCQMPTVPKEQEVAAEVGGQEEEVVEGEIEVEGTVEAESYMTLGVEFPSEVIGIHVKVGDMVTKGQSLITMDLSQYEKQLEQARLNEQMQQLNGAATQELESVYVKQKASLAQTLADKKADHQNKTSPEYGMYANQLESIQAREVRMLEDYETIKALHEAGGVPTKDLEDMQVALEDLTREKENVNYQINQLETLQEDEIKALENQLKELDVSIANEQKQKEHNQQVAQLSESMQQVEIEKLEAVMDKDYLQESQVIAPKEGLVVSQIFAQTGMQSTHLMGGLIELVDLESKVVVAKVPEEYVRDLAVGDAVSVVPYIDQTQTLKGTVKAMGAIAKEHYGEKVIEATIQVEDVEGLLILGGSVDVLF